MDDAATDAGTSTRSGPDTSTSSGPDSSSDSRGRAPATGHLSSGVRPARVGVIVAALLAVAAVAGAVVWAIGGDDEADEPLSERLALGAVPAGYEVSSAYDSADLAGSGGGGRAVILAEDGASLLDGRWMGISVVAMTPASTPANDTSNDTSNDTTGDQAFDPDLEFPGENRRTVSVDTDDGPIAAAVGITYDGRPGLVMGPVDGHVISIVGHDVDETEVLSTAASVTVVDGEPVITDRPAGLEEIGRASGASSDVAVSLLSGLFLGGSGGALVSYDPTDASASTRTAPIQLSSRPLDGDDPDGLVRFVLGEVREVDVDGRRALAGSFELAGYSTDVVSWQRGGRLITLVSILPLDAAVAVAESVVDLTPEEWTALRERATTFGSS